MDAPVSPISIPCCTHWRRHPLPVLAWNLDERLLLEKIYGERRLEETPETASSLLCHVHIVASDLTTMNLLPITRNRSFKGAINLQNNKGPCTMNSIRLFQAP